MSIFQELYDREINVSVSSFWDGGWDVRIGDDMNGYRAGTNVSTWAAVEEWLRRAASELYPKSRMVPPHHEIAKALRLAIEKLKDVEKDTNYAFDDYNTPERERLISRLERALG